MSRINEKLGAWLINGNTKTRLSKELGVSRQTLRLKLSGDSDWTWSQVVKIAELTGTSLDELAGVPDGNSD